MTITPHHMLEEEEVEPQNGADIGMAETLDGSSGNDDTELVEGLRLSLLEENIRLEQGTTMQNDVLQEQLPLSREEALGVVGRPGLRKQTSFTCTELFRWKILSLLLFCTALVFLIVSILFWTNGERLLNRHICNSNDDCAANNGTGTCALSEYDAEATRICCSSAVGATFPNSDFLLATFPNSDFLLVCTERPDGSYCGPNNSVCASGICVKSICLSARLVGGEPCVEDTDCGSNSCRQVSLENSTKVCCTGGSSGDAAICPGMTPIEGACTENGACLSDFCQEGKCVEQNTLDDNELCNDNRECRSLACGRASAADSIYDPSERICCESGETVTGGSYYNDREEYDETTFCGSQPPGTFCASLDAICASHLCINSFCTDQALDTGEVCEDNNHCMNNACGFPSLDTSLPKICCESGEIFDLYVDGQYQYFCAKQPAGTFCQAHDQLCARNLCIGEICVDEKATVGDFCNGDGHCENNACGLAVANASIPEVCCERGETVSAYFEGENRAFCKYMQTGTYCHSIDEICASGICINQTCADTPLANNAVCTADAHCLSNACGRVDLLADSPKVCCESGASISLVLCNSAYHENDDCYGGDEVQVCASLPTGAYCDSFGSLCSSGICLNGSCTDEALDANQLCQQDSDCKSMACGHAIADVSAPTVCCESGATTEGNALNGYATVCTRATLGTYCHEIEEMCESGKCIARACAEGKLDDGSHCFKSSDCQTNACGLIEARSDAASVCCESADTVNGLILGDPPSSGTVCTQSKLGTLCNEIDAMCESGLCINGRCGNETLQDNQICSMSTNCQSGSCALAEADADASMVCCSEGRSTYINVRGSSSRHHVCQHLATGAYCHETNVCENELVCVAGHCSEHRLELLSNCTSNLDCQSSTCALSSANAEAPTVCVAAGSTIKTQVLNSIDEHDVQQNLPLDAYCHESDELCNSGFCVKGRCAEQRLEAFEHCILPTDCQSNACGLTSVDDDYESSPICCAGGESIDIINVFSVSAHVCSNAPEGTRCANWDEICASGKCVNGTCAALLDDETECTPENHSSCKSSVCARASADPEDESFICCKDGEWLAIDPVGVNYQPDMVYVCGKRPSGVYCDNSNNEDMCESGVCLRDFCE